MPPRRPEGLIEGSGRAGEPKTLASSLEDPEDLERLLLEELEKMKDQGLIQPGYSVSDVSWDAETGTLKATVKVALVLPDQEEGTIHDT